MSQQESQIFMSPKITSSIVALEELHRREELESLRQFLISEQCFPTLKDPSTAPISMEELKKLARAWKLNERRNFWKNHSERNQMVSALLQHVSDNPSLFSKGMTRVDGPPGSAKIESKPMSSHKRPTPPSDIRPSATREGKLLKNVCGLQYFNREKTATELLTNSRFSQFPTTDSSIDKQIVKWRTEDFNMKDLSLVDPAFASKRQTISGVTNSTRIALMSNNISNSTNAKKLKEKKHQNLSLHLVNYSANPELNKTTLTLRAVQTFVNVAESDNPAIVSNCVIALSNISSHPHVRSLLIEINALHKLSNLMAAIKGAQASWAAALLFYYFSCDKETEDRVYNTCSSLLQTNGSSNDPNLRLVTLYTLNNLMPCIDRQRVADTTMRIINTNFDVNTAGQSLSTTYLLILQNMAAFSSAHSTLLSLDIIPLLHQVATLAAKDHNTELGLSVVKMQHSLLQVPEQVSNLVTKDFIGVIVILLSIGENEIIHQCLKVVTVLSCQLSSSLSSLLLTETDLVRNISDLFLSKTSLLASASLGMNTLTICREAVKFFLNVTIYQQSMSQPNIILESKIPDALINIMKALDRPNPTSKPNTGGGRSTYIAGGGALSPMMAIAMTIKRLAMKTFQNILSAQTSCLKLVYMVTDPIVKVLTEHHDLGGAHALFNLSCSLECRVVLVEQGIHHKLVEFLSSNISTGDAGNSVRLIYLQILVQLSSLKQCILDLLKVDIIDKLRGLIESPPPSAAAGQPTSARGTSRAEAAMKKAANPQLAARNTSRSSIASPPTGASPLSFSAASSTALAGDVTLMLLAVVAFASDQLQQQDRANTLQILKNICVKGASVAVIENCANVLKHISEKFCEYDSLHPVVKGILDISSSVNESDDVMDSLSTVLYNMTCRESNLDPMLQDAYYVNTMIRIMRKGKVGVQENIAKAMSTLCCERHCTDILIRTDILSDLIVIALLKTSSEEIKKVCSEAFYNMFCHDGTRLQLLKGDLWWAMMRLCRQDSNEVRTISARALYNFSCDPDTVEPLRRHHILSFIKDICSSGDEEFLAKCLSAAHNIIRQFGPSSKAQNSSEFEAHEVIASVHIGQEGLARCSQLISLKNAIVLLLKCSQHRVAGMAHEFINVEIVDVLTSSKSKWGSSLSCCLYVSRMLRELSSHSVFTKGTTLADLDPLCSMLLLSYIHHKREFSAEIHDNIAAVFLQFVNAENLPTTLLLATESLGRLLQDVVGNESRAIAIKTAADHSKLRSAGGGKSMQHIAELPDSQLHDKRRPAHSENTAYATYTSFCSCRVALTALFSRSVETIVLEQPDLVTPSIVSGFLSDDLCVDTLTIGHVLVIIHFLSEVPALCSHLVDAHVFRVLDTYITRASATNEFKTAQEFCAIFLRNISLHSANLTKYACEKASFLHSLLSNTIDDASDAAVNLDISLFLCNVSDYLLDIDTEDDENIKASPHTYTGKASQQQHRNSKSGGKVSFLTPKMVLKHIQKISPAIENDTQSSIASINKYTVSNILSKYAFTSGVDPLFIQSMFTYLRKNDVTVPETAVNLTFKPCNEIVASRPAWVEAVTSELSRGGKSSVVVPLEAFAADDSYWQPIQKTGYKRNQNIILKALTATVIRYETLEKCDSPPITAFIKIEKEFEMVRSGHSDQLAITEGDEKEEEDNDDDDDDLYTDAEQSDISPGIDKQPLSPASVGVSGGNQEFKDASEEHDDSVTVAGTQEEN